MAPKKVDKVDTKETTICVDYKRTIKIAKKGRKTALYICVFLDTKKRKVAH